jgi:hypothetical protein
MLGTPPPSPLLLTARRRLQSLLVANDIGENDGPIEYHVEAAIPLYRLKSTGDPDRRVNVATVKAGSRLLISQGAKLFIADAVRNKQGYGFGLITGTACLHWLDALRRVPRRRSIATKLLELRILQIQALHSEYLWMRLRGGDTLVRFNWSVGVPKGQRQEKIPAVMARIKERLYDRAQLHKRLQTMTRTLGDLE